MVDVIRFDDATIGAALGPADADDAEPADRLVGHVDSSDDRGISGWLANMDRPERLEPVLCTDGDGGEVVFRTWHVREDVCRFFGIDGRFGFVIPSSSLRVLKGPVTVRDRTGSPLAGGSDLWPPRAAAARGDGPAVVFLHIPKTAGTSVRNSLIEGLEPSGRLFVYMPPYGLTVDEIVALPLAQRRAARMIVGHMHFGIDRVLGQEARYLTFLREPMARLRSQVAHHHRAGTSFSGPSGPVTLQEAVAEGLDEQFDNLMTRVVAGLPEMLLPLGAVTQDALELAMFNVENHFAHVGLVETLDEDMRALSAALPWTVGAVRRENVNEDADWLSRSGLTIDWAALAERNRFDRLLYERLRERRARVPRGRRT